MGANNGRQKEDGGMSVDLNITKPADEPERGHVQGWFSLLFSIACFLNPEMQILRVRFP